MFGWYGHGGGPGWIFLGFANMALWIAIIFVVVSLLRPRHRGWWSHSAPLDVPPAPPVSGKTSVRAIEILQERLARGEISEDDYRRLSEVLRST